MQIIVIVLVIVGTGFISVTNENILFYNFLLILLALWLFRTDIAEIVRNEIAESRINHEPSDYDYPEPDVFDHIFSANEDEGEKVKKPKKPKKSKKKS